MSNEQEPIGSGFDATSTAEEVIDGIDLTGKVAVVTGGYSGIGLETVRVLRSAGAKVIVPARNQEKATDALADIDVTIERMDLLSPESIDGFVQRFLSTGEPLHILVNNAGIMALPELERDARGYELHFATNHLGHFQLATGLSPALRRAEGARVVSVSSLGHRYSPVVFEDVNFEHRPYDKWAAYGQSKTANILFAVGFDDRFKGDSIRAFSLHPGSIVDTGLDRHVSRDELIEGGILDADGTPILDPEQQLKTVEQGAATSVWCATSPDLEGKGGLYCENADVASVMRREPDDSTMSDSSQLTGVLPYAIDADSADRLWSLSEEMLGRYS
ncbi:oxidoreductase [Haladaptatus sp. AB618]|uniref:oxidoreductase n=1 Tax=Haladaptatus sp. AB618 TaxID=2934173 RepID=UPI00209C4AD9|nr:oxidoreductase [Haladaptatus sp. AB618]